MNEIDYSQTENDGLSMDRKSVENDPVKNACNKIMDMYGRKLRIFIVKTQSLTFKKYTFFVDLNFEIWYEVNVLQVTTQVEKNILTIIIT